MGERKGGRRKKGEREWGERRREENERKEEGRWRIKEKLNARGLEKGKKEIGNGERQKDKISYRVGKET